MRGTVIEKGWSGNGGLKDHFRGGINHRVVQAACFEGESGKIKRET